MGELGMVRKQFSDYIFAPFSNFVRAFYIVCQYVMLFTLLWHVLLGLDLQKYFHTDERCNDVGSNARSCILRDWNNAPLKEMLIEF